MLNGPRRYRVSLSPLIRVLGAVRALGIEGAQRVAEGILAYAVVAQL